MLSRRELIATPFAACMNAAVRRPNIVFILVDDLRWDELACTGHRFASTPNADRLAREGATFQNAFASTPLCSPSRAAFLTSLYSHSNGIIDNVARDALSHQLVTWPRLLHDEGYRTAFIGKWHMGNDDSPRPGFDRWISFRGQGTCNDPDLNIDGQRVSSRGDVTDLLTDHALEFVDQQRSEPFCFYLSHKAIHPNVQQRDDGSRVDPEKSDAPEAFIPAERHKDLYLGRTPPRRGNYLKPPQGKPALENNPPGTTPLGSESATTDAGILARMRMMKAVDESTGLLLKALERKKVLDDTMFVFTSDHGFFYGEHCLGAERRLAYEETIRIPLLVRHPSHFVPGSKPSQLVMNLDVGASILALTGIKPRQALHGRPLWTKSSRDAVLIEYYSDTVYPRIHKMGYHAVRTNRWKLIRYRDLRNADELYDLRSDAFELHNLIHEKATPVQQLDSRLRDLLMKTGAPRIAT